MTEQERITIKTKLAIDALNNGKIGLTRKLLESLIDEHGVRGSKAVDDALAVALAKNI